MYRSLLQSIIVFWGWTDFDGEELRLWFHGQCLDRHLFIKEKPPIGMTARMSLFHFLMLNCSYFESYHQSKIYKTVKSVYRMQLQF